MPVITLEMQLVMAAQLLLAGLLSMVIGLNRERREKDAGLRTHMLVGIGACMFSALSVAALPPNEAGRIVANVVTGVGFLGAGIIYRSKRKAHDLTTAASIWITAAIGMAVGLGAWFLALCGTVIIWLVLEMLQRWEKTMFSQKPRGASPPDDGAP